MVVVIYVDVIMQRDTHFCNLIIKWLQPDGLVLDVAEQIAKSSNINGVATVINKPWPYWVHQKLLQNKELPKKQTTLDDWQLRKVKNKPQFFIWDLANPQKPKYVAGWDFGNAVSTFCCSYVLSMHLSSKT